jgi:hypothetical protein
MQDSATFFRTFLGLLYGRRSFCSYPRSLLFGSLLCRSSFRLGLGLCSRLLFSKLSPCSGGDFFPGIFFSFLFRFLFTKLGYSGG